MNPFDIIYKFAIIGFLLSIIILLGQIKNNTDKIENLLVVPDVELPQP
jgi:hypothetical protein